MLGQKSNLIWKALRICRCAAAVFCCPNKEQKHLVIERKEAHVMEIPYGALIPHVNLSAGWKNIYALFVLMDEGAL